MGSLPRATPVARYGASLQPKSPGGTLSDGRRALTDTTNRQTLNHSPIESPPTIKKKLCRLAKGLLDDRSAHQGALDGLDAAFVFEAPAVEIAQIALGGVPQSLQKSRLERSSSVASSDRSSSILKKQCKNFRGSLRARSLTTSSEQSQRNVKFQDNVTVYRIDDDGSYVCTECQKLRGDVLSMAEQEDLYSGGHTGYSNLQRALPATNQGYLSHGAQNGTLVRQNTPPPTQSPPQAKPQTVTNILQPHSTRVPQSSHQSLEGSTRSQSLLQSQEGSPVQFTFAEDPLHGLRLRFSVPLGQGYGPTDIVVKANMSGSRVRVIANKTTPDGHQVEQFNERYPLPMDVDPYRVTARLDVKGQLIVEAPLLTLGRRQALTDGRAQGYTPQ